MTVTRMSPPTDPPATRRSLHGPLAAVLAGQLLLGFGLTAPGAVLLAVVLVGLLTHGLVAGRLLEEGAARPLVVGPLPDALGALSLVALMGLLDAAQPLGSGHPVANAALVGVGMLVAVAVVMRPAPVRTLRSSMRVSWTQALVGLAGVPYGVVTAVLVHPGSLAPAGLSARFAGALVVAGILGAAAELVFRGVVQTALGPALGSRGIVAGAVLSAGAAGVSGSVPLAMSAGVVGLLLGWWVDRTDSLWGAAAAHCLLYMVIVIYAGRT